ncbi:dual specificity protein phosphatase family protein [uncultured Caulobacter sp.]|uniref:protein-tyrosine phosphatase family protein n=1 Tax=uncultured Caulobacter sp. TaxID=158749 RepID=UPI002605784B|nr:dual specificity protein phosphatase [uncultured Caulobacter sp.]
MGDGCDLDWITEDLAIGGCCAPEALASLARDHRLGAVIDARAEAIDEAAAWESQGVVFLSLPTEDHAAVTPEMLRTGLDFAERAQRTGRRLLIHCQHGIGRSVMLALCVLVERGMGALEALVLVKSRRRKASPSVEQIEAWRAWLSRRGQAAPSFEACAAIAYARAG